MTLDARALVTIARKEAGCERLVEAIADDDHPCIAATALAEAAIILAARGEKLAEVVVQNILNRLELSVVPLRKSIGRARSGSMRSVPSPARAIGRVRAVLERGGCVEVGRANSRIAQA